MGFDAWKMTESFIDAVPVVGTVYRAGSSAVHLAKGEQKDAWDDVKNSFINLGWDAAAVATLGGAEELRLGAAALKVAGRRGMVQLVADPNMSISAVSTALKAANCDTSVLDKLGRKITGATKEQQPDLAKVLEQCRTARPDPDPKEPVWLADSEAPVMSHDQRAYVAASLGLLALAIFFSDW